MTAGTSTTYTVTVTNNGPSTEPVGVVVFDTIPAGTTGTTLESDCVTSAVTFTCTTSAPLAPGGSVSYLLTLAVDPTYVAPTLTNTATITTFPLTDPVAGNNSATDTDIITRSADLSITKTDGVGSVTAGTSTTYTVTVTNNGPSTEPVGVVVFDTIPAGTTGTTLEPDCVTSAVTFTCTTSAPLAPGGSVSYLLTLAVDPTYVAPTLVNTATITFVSRSPTRTPANDSATDVDTVTQSADLSITKTDSADPVTPGQAFTYTLTVTNAGPSNATGLTVSDTVPPQFALTGTATGPGSCGNVGNAVTCNLAALAATGTWVITVSVTAGATGGTFTNTATVSGTEADPVPGNNSASQTTTITPQADLSITKTDGVGSVTAGTSTTYTVTVTNNGPSTEPVGVVVSDTIPAGTTGTTLEPDCVTSAVTFTCTTSAPLAPGGSVSYLLTLAVDPTYVAPTLVNTASITSSPISDPNPANDSATDTDTVTAVGRSVDHQDGRRGLRDRRRLDHLHDHRDQRRPVDRACRRRRLGHVPGRYHRHRDRARLCDLGRHFTCTTSAPLAPAPRPRISSTSRCRPGTCLSRSANTATITTSPIADPNAANDSASDIDTVTTSADLGSPRRTGSRA